MQGQPSRARRPLAVMLSMLAHVGVLALCALGGLRGATRPPEPEPVKVRLSAWRRASPPKAAEPAKLTPRRPRPRPPVVQPSAIVQPTPPPPPEAEPQPQPAPEAPVLEGDPNGTAAPEAAVAEASATGSPFGTVSDAALELGQVARAPALRDGPTPDYPRQARNERIEGLVVLRVIIDREGRVEPAGIKVVRSVPALDGAAIAAVQRWRFVPALDHQGRLVRVVVEIPFEFSLH